MAFDEQHAKALRELEAARAEVERLRGALRRIAAVEPTPGKAARNVGAMLQMQAIARATLDGVSASVGETK
jgi:hypothetical protein